MPEIIHFRGSEKIIKKKNLEKDVNSPFSILKLCSTAPFISGN